MAITGWKTFTEMGRSAAAVGVALALLVPGCELDRRGIGADPPENVKLRTEPELVCPGESTGVRWDMSRFPFAAENCQRCTRHDECDASAGLGCIDNVCCRRDSVGIIPCVSAGRCPPMPRAIEMSLRSSDALSPVPPLPSPVPLRGGVHQQGVDRAMNFVADGRFRFPGRTISDSARVRVTDNPDDPIVMRFAFRCVGDRFEWDGHDFLALGPSTSANVVINGILNASSFRVGLFSSSAGPSWINPSGTTREFNGNNPRGAWRAFVPPDARGDFPSVACTPEGNPDRRLDIVLLMQVTCRRR